MKAINSAMARLSTHFASMETVGASRRVILTIPPLIRPTIPLNVAQPIGLKAPRFLVRGFQWWFLTLLLSIIYAYILKMAPHIEGGAKGIPGGAVCLAHDPKLEIVMQEIGTAIG